jgi:hypothetical protein
LLVEYDEPANYKEAMEGPEYENGWKPWNPR